MEDYLDERLKKLDPTFDLDDSSVPTFLLFDEGQVSYQDDMLWNDFLKGVHDRLYNNYCVILFCSYRSPSACPLVYKRGTLPVLSHAALVSLRPTKKSIGLLLNRDGFDQVVARHHRKLNLHPDLLDDLFNWTVGHVGAIVQLLDAISYQVSLWQDTYKLESSNYPPQRVAEMRGGAQLTVDVFHEGNPPHLLIPGLQVGGFGHGLPQEQELQQDPSMVGFF